MLAPSCCSSSPAAPSPLPRRLRPIRSPPRPPARRTAGGPRLGGTPGEAAARDVVAALLAESGLAVEQAPFSWEPWLPGDASITVDGATFPAEPLSPSPPTDGLELPLADGVVE